ncbi:MAG: hypothetical protein AAF570_13960, partial [Bacteroidota bacterium]
MPHITNHLLLLFLLFSTPTFAQNTYERVLPAKCETFGVGICPGPGEDLLVTVRNRGCHRRRIRRDSGDVSLENNLYVLQVDASGTPQQVHRLPGQSGTDLQRCADGGYIFASYATRLRPSNYRGDKTAQLVVVRTGPDLQVRWQHLLKSDYNSTPVNITECRDGGFLFLATSEIPGNLPNAMSGITRSVHPRLIKLDAEGHLVWENTNDSLIDYLPTHTIQNADGGFMTTAVRKFKSSRTMGMMILKHDAKGRFLWEMNISDEKHEDELNYKMADQIIELDNGDVLVAGRCRTYFPSLVDHQRILRISAKGKILWDHLFPGESIGQPRMALQGSENVILMGPADHKERKHGPEGNPSFLQVTALNLDGELLWQKEYAENDFPESGDLYVDEAGGIHWVGAVRPFEKQSWNAYGNGRYRIE